MEKYYFVQNYKSSCSASSVCILYNYIFKIKKNKQLTEDDIFDKYPKWVFLTKRKQGITMKCYKLYIQKVFKRKVKIIKKPTSQQLIKDLKSKNIRIIIYFFDKDEYNGHYSPAYKYKNGKVLLDKAKNHKLVWKPISWIIKKMNGKNCPKGYLKFRQKRK